MFTLRAETVDFIDTAPVRLEFGVTLKAPAKAVFEAIADDPTVWPTWFAAVRRSEYGGERPYGVGTPRRVLLYGGVAFHETVIAWDAPTRYAYRIDRTNVPGLHGFVERWTVREAADGTTLLTWAMAIDATAPMRLAVKASAPGVGVAFRRAARVLDLKLAAG